MSWQSYGSDHSLVSHLNDFDESYRVSIENADEFSQSECAEIQDQADAYFADCYLEDVPEYGMYAGRTYIVEFEKGIANDEVCFLLDVTFR